MSRRLDQGRPPAHRVVRGLVWAREGKGPGWGRSRARGAKAKGLRYEAALAKFMATHGASHGRWFEFEDLFGRGWCQPDFLLVGTRSIVVCEAKYTWTPNGHAQIDELYAPVCQAIWPEHNVVGMQICKVLTPDCDARIAHELREAVQSALGGARTALHWIDAG